MSATPTPDQPLSFGRYELLELGGEVEALDGGPHAPRLRYRKGGGGTWRAVPMRPVGPAGYAATVPVSRDAGTELDYIEDGDQRLGSPSSPFRVPVR